MVRSTKPSAVDRDRETRPGFRIVVDLGLVRKILRVARLPALVIRNGVVDKLFPLSLVTVVSRPVQQDSMADTDREHDPQPRFEDEDSEQHRDAREERPLGVGQDQRATICSACHDLLPGVEPHSGGPPWSSRYQQSGGLTPDRTNGVRNGHGIILRI